MKSLTDGDRKEHHRLAHEQAPGHGDRGEDCQQGANTSQMGQELVDAVGEEAGGGQRQG